MFFLYLSGEEDYIMASSNSEIFELYVKDNDDDRKKSIFGPLYVRDTDSGRTDGSRQVIFGSPSRVDYSHYLSLRLLYIDEETLRIDPIDVSLSHLIFLKYNYGNLKSDSFIDYEIELDGLDVLLSQADSKFRMVRSYRNFRVARIKFNFDTPAGIVAKDSVEDIKGKLEVFGNYGDISWQSHIKTKLDGEYFIADTDMYISYKNSCIKVSTFIASYPRIYLKLNDGEFDSERKQGYIAGDNIVGVVSFGFDSGISRRTIVSMWLLPNIKIVHTNEGITKVIGLIGIKSQGTVIPDAYDDLIQDDMSFIMFCPIILGIQDDTILRVVFDVQDKRTTYHLSKRYIKEYFVAKNVFGES